MISGVNIPQCVRAVFDAVLAFSGEPIQYCFRKTGETVSLQAVRTEPGRDDEGGEGKRLYANAVVWTFYVSTLGALPSAGDVITDSKGAQYDVLPVGGTIYEQRDPYGFIIKLNTKRSSQQWAA